MKTFALLTVSFLFSIIFVFDCSAQVKTKKIKRPIIQKRRVSKDIVAVNQISDLDNISCLASQNTPRPEINLTTRTSKGYLISDCMPMNLTALYQPKPVYPKTAGAVRASGLVSVEVVIDEAGKVIWAKVVEGHPLIHAEALRIACHTRFKPVVDCLKRRVKSNTIINYNFKTDN